MCKITSLGAHAFKKYGEENVTFYQLAQAEEAGLWGCECINNTGSAKVICFAAARAKIYINFIKTHSRHILKLCV